MIRLKESSTAKVTAATTALGPAKLTIAAAEAVKREGAQEVAVKDQDGYSLWLTLMPQPYPTAQEWG